MSGKPKIDPGLPPEFLAMIEPARPIKMLDAVRALPGAPQHAQWKYHTTEVAHAEAMLANLEKTWAETLAAHAANESAIAHNTLMRERVSALLAAAGFPNTVRRRKKSRPGYVPRFETIPAGWIGDLDVAFPVLDGFMHELMAYDARLPTYRAYAAQQRQKANDALAMAAQERQQVIARRQADMRLAAILLRYELGPENDWPEVLEALRKRSKYLDLAIAGIETRGDWSDGFYRVQDAMGRFKIDSDQDKEIAADLMGCLAGDERDGRIFRDTRWSYSALLGLVDKQLAEDAQFALAQIPT